MKREPQNPVGIKEIAKALGISIGTVDRALHGRPGISAATQARVLKMAAKLDYKPNLAARSLKLNRKLRIVVHLPEQIACFYDPVREGISAAADATLSIQLKVDFRSFPRLGEGDLEAVEADLKEKMDGVILAVGNQARIGPLLGKLAERNVAVVCVTSDAPRSPRLSAVTVDASVSGGIAAELLAWAAPSGGSVVPITGDLNTQDHVEKLRGFAATLATCAPHVQLLPCIESHDRPDEAYRQTLALLRKKPRPDGIYIATANSLPVLRALEEQELLGKVQVVTTDLFAELVPFLESHSVLATLNQRPFRQGRLAFDVLLGYLASGTRPQPVISLAPHIVLRSNLPLFSEQLLRHSG
jgi:LacI family transcriptional regulator